MLAQLFIHFLSAVALMGAIVCVLFFDEGKATSRATDALLAILFTSCCVLTIANVTFAIADLIEIDAALHGPMELDVASQSE